MKLPPRGNGVLPKTPTLSLTKSSEPKRWTKPETTRSPVRDDDDPVRILTPASAAAGPTVGANCRGGVTADAMGMAKLWGRWDAGGPG
jgi:hypothetical protein